MVIFATSDELLALPEGDIKFSYIFSPLEMSAPTLSDAVLSSRYFTRTKKLWLLEWALYFESDLEAINGLKKEFREIYSS